jgi:anti-anti-sigma factor
MTSVELEKLTAKGSTARKAIIALPGKLDVNATTKLKDALTQAAADAETITLNAADVTRASTAACQLIAAFCKTMAMQGKRVIFLEASNPFTRAFTILGLAHVLESEFQDNAHSHR